MSGTVLRALGRALPGLLGLVLVAFGAWLAWPPAGLMVAGVLLLADRAWEQIRADRGAR
ncbi:hypothetical protein [Microbispora triticiradicis]|uniref:hypothetical protein n=1 Tax=Microbispora triticiradicis TaxID=2200763 RepID=UPI001AD6F30C|nr:hypothetical protein [Microbispora triticiradicis]